MKYKRLLGKEIEFIAHRIHAGNPVTGILLDEDDEDINVRLTKDIEGLVTTWSKGAERLFDKSLISAVKPITKSKK